MRISRSSHEDRGEWDPVLTCASARLGVLIVPFHPSAYRLAGRIPNSTIGSSRLGRLLHLPSVPGHAERTRVVVVCEYCPLQCSRAKHDLEDCRGDMVVWARRGGRASTHANSLCGDIAGRRKPSDARSYQQLITVKLLRTFG